MRLDTQPISGNYLLAQDRVRKKKLRCIKVMMFLWQARSFVVELVVRQFFECAQILFE